MGSTFNASFSGIGEMLHAGYMQREMRRRAEAGKRFAEATAPYDPDSTDGTHFKDSFEVEDRPLPDRACAALVNTDPAAFQIEVGTSDTPAHHTLKRALDIMGA